MELANMWQHYYSASSTYPIGCKLHRRSNHVCGEDHRLRMSLFWWGTSSLLNLRMMKMQLIPATSLHLPDSSPRMRFEAGWGIYWEAQMPWWELCWSLHHRYPLCKLLCSYHPWSSWLHSVPPLKVFCSFCRRLIQKRCARTLWLLLSNRACHQPGSSTGQGGWQQVCFLQLLLIKAMNFSTVLWRLSSICMDHFHRTPCYMD